MKVDKTDQTYQKECIFPSISMQYGLPISAALIEK